jgi:hypothetical protein
MYAAKLGPKLGPIFGLCVTFFFAIAAAVADEDPAASNQNDLKLSLPAHSTAGGAEKKFFGSLEFDWNPDAPGGVPGFGPHNLASEVVAAQAEMGVSSNHGPVLQRDLDPDNQLRRWQR